MQCFSTNPPTRWKTLVKLSQDFEKSFLVADKNSAKTGEHGVTNYKATIRLSGDDFLSSPLGNFQQPLSRGE